MNGPSAGKLLGLLGYAAVVLLVNGTVTYTLIGLGSGADWRSLLPTSRVGALAEPNAARPDGLGAEGHAQRRMQDYDDDDDFQYRKSRKSDENEELIQSLFSPAVWLCSLVGAALSTACYWCLQIKPQPDRYVPMDFAVPEDLKGRWVSGIFDCCQAPGTFGCFFCCGPCAIVELWLRAGYLHAQLGAQECCPGGWWCLGLCGWGIVQQVGGSCCLPCAYAALRGGVSFVDGSDGGMGDIIPMRKRFNLPHEGWSTFIRDCCLWCWCSACAGTQEWQQIHAVLARMPPGPTVQVAIGQIVGQPQPVQAQAVWKDEGNPTMTN